MGANQKKVKWIAFILICLLPISLIYAIFTFTATIPNIGQVDYNKVDNFLWIEAEDASGMYLVSVAEDVEASSGKYIYAPDGTDPMEEGYVEYNINIQFTDTFKLWGRVYWPDNNANSFSVAFDREPLDSDVFGNDNLMSQWHWVQGLEYPLSAGTHILKFKDREDGSRLDIILLTNDLSYTPTGKGEFTGKKMEYVYWLRDGHSFHIDDDPGLKPRNGVVNDALLYLAIGPDCPSSFIDGKTVESAYMDQLLEFVDQDYDFGNDRDRVLASIAESYLNMRDEGIFSLDEQERLEKFFLRWADRNAKEDYGHQFVPHALAAVVSYVLKSTKTGIDYGSDINRLRGYALSNALDFGETFGPIENSAHYNPFVFISMLRISIYCNDGVLPESHITNLRKSVEWILDVYPHNGFGLSFGETWGHDHVRQLFSFLIGAAHFLDDGNLENVLVAQNAKWLSNKLFNYGLTHSYIYEEYRREDWAPGCRGEPMWIWKYAKDSLIPLKPDINKHGSKAVYGEMGNSYSSRLPHNLKIEKIVHRDGWDSDSFYLSLDLAPSCGKNKPYANSIVNFVYGNEPFSSGKTRDRYLTTWELRNVVSPTTQHTDATLIFMENFNQFSASKTSAGNWDRYISFVKNNSYAVIFDFASSVGTAYWHLQGIPIWYSDFVELKKGNYQLNVYYPNNNDWYIISHYDNYSWNESEKKNQWAYVGNPSRELELSGARTWAAVLFPYRGENPTILSILPIKNGSSIYPDAAGVKLIHSTYTDWNGASRTSGRITYDIIETDSEVFWARKTFKQWTISFVNGEFISIHMSSEPIAVKINGNPLTEGTDWSYSDGLLTIDISEYISGTLTINF